MSDYFENDNLCKCCGVNTKKANQIVCDNCQLIECLPEWIDGE